MRARAAVIVMLIVLSSGVARAQIETAAGTADAAPPEEVFARGNESYEAGDYDGAIEAYGSLVARGAVDADLFYNMGNAYYEIGALGPAVLYYERALRLDPRNRDAAANLALTRKILRDREFVVSEGWLRRALLWAPRTLSTKELVLIGSMLYFLLTLIVIAFVFRDTRFVSGVYRRFSLLSPGRLFGLQKTTDIAMAGVTVFVLLCASGAAAWERHRVETLRRDAVILEEELAVYSGPSTQATLQFKIHEGTITRVVDARQGWVEIELPGELSGWVRSDALERI